MKKFLFLIIAGSFIIGTSAFTIFKVSKPDQSNTSLFWYEYDHINDELGALLNPDPDVTILKAQVDTDCEDDAGEPDCVRGYSENNRAFQVNPPTPVDQIKMTEQ